MTNDIYKDNTIMAIDLLEHLEDYRWFLTKLKDKGKYKIFCDTPGFSC